MSGNTQTPPAPVGQQAPPMRAAALDSWWSLRVAHGPLLLTTGTAFRRGREHKVIDASNEH